MKRLVWMYGNSHVITDDNHEVKTSHDVTFGEVPSSFLGRHGKRKFTRITNRNQIRRSCIETRLKLVLRGEFNGVLGFCLCS